MESGRRWNDITWDVWVEFTENTSLHGFHYLTARGKHWMERLMWTLIQMLAIFGAVYNIHGVYEEFVTSPTVTTIDSTTYPVWNMPFPGVSICTLNRISRKAATDFARDVATRLKLNPSHVYDLLKELGRLYDSNVQNATNTQQLHELLIQYNRKKMYNITKIMVDLTPKCQDLFTDCYWLGKQKNCSRLFKLRKTMDGFCCVFNYQRPVDEFGKELKDPSKNLRYVNSIGYTTGLSAIIDNQMEDYMYALLPTYGIKVLIFSPWSFPDMASGGVNEKLVYSRAEAFLRVRVEHVHATEEVHAFSIQQRGCLTHDEMPELFGNTYTLSECLVSCRAKSIVTLCGCLPFYLPKMGKTRTCNVLDSICLARYKEKWVTQRPPAHVPGLEAEREESISCNHCLPECSPLFYRVKATTTTMRRGQHSFSGHAIINHSLIHVFFGDSYSLRLRHDILYFWYDLLSNFGGVCALFTGFSIISAFEFLYYFTMRLFFAIRLEILQHKNREKKSLKLYLTEFKGDLL